MFTPIRQKVVLGVAFLVVVVCSHSMGAAKNDGSVQGVVKNASGAPVAGAFVKLKNADRRLTFMVVSQAQGRYNASSLPAGKYTVQGIGNSFQSEWSAPVDVAAGGRPATVNLSLASPQAPAL